MFFARDSYRLVGSHANGLLFRRALVVNATSVAAIVLLAWRRGRRPLTLATAIGLALLCRSVGADFLRDPWNPYITVLPFAALIFLAWSIVCGDVWMLPVAVLVASFIVQSHVGYAALVVVVLGVAMVWRRRSRTPSPRRRRRSEPPPLMGRAHRNRGGHDRRVAAAAHRSDRNGGNLQAIWKFFGKPHTTPTTSTALRLVGKALAFPGAWFTGGETVNTSKLLIPAVSGFFVPVGLVALALCIQMLRCDAAITTRRHCRCS